MHADLDVVDKKRDIPTKRVRDLAARSRRLRIFREWLFRLGYMILIIAWVILTLDITWPAISTLRNSQVKYKITESSGVNYLVIAPQALEKTASAWADYRESSGYQTEVILLSPSQAKEQLISELIQNTYAENKEPTPFYVLLVGHAHPFSSNPDTFIPAAHFTVDQSRSSTFGPDPIASDDGYASNNSTGLPDHQLPIIIGRIPARTEEEGLLLLERTKSYEARPPTGESRTRIELVTSNAGFGSEFDPIFEWALRILIQKILPDEYTWHMLNGNASSPYNFPVDLFPNEVAQRFNTGALAVVYIGHGQPDMLAWAYSPQGIASRIFNVKDAQLINNANSSLAIFTACSAGRYDLIGDDISLVESIYLTPGGPVATYSSSAWINGILNGRLVLDIFETLLINKPPILGEWVSRIETWSESMVSNQLLPAVLKALIPRLSRVYNNSLFYSQSQAHLELDVQHATYNLFGDPALRIAYPQMGLEISPDLSWQLQKGSLTFHGKGNFPAGQQVSISLERIFGSTYEGNDQFNGAINQYFQANNPVISHANASIGSKGNFSGRLIIPPATPGGKYLIKAVSIVENHTYVDTHPVYIGWPSVLEIMTSVYIFWSIITSVLLIKVFRFRSIDS